MVSAREVYCTRVQTALEKFYHDNPQIGASHGLSHVMAVHEHAVKAIESHNDNLEGENVRSMGISDVTAMEIRVAAMLHDADDRKFFPSRGGDPPNNGAPDLPNASRICRSAGVPPESASRILKMISWVGCTENGNSVPREVQTTGRYDMLIPRWSDRLEAVGRRGVVRCYRYNRETGAALWKDGDGYDSPRPASERELWELAAPERFRRYLRGERGAGCSMISHYYDKLLHVARPPPGIVRNKYLEEMGSECSRELVEVCLRFGAAGVVDEAYILSLEKELGDG